jgi:hypothetical protein
MCDCTAEDQAELAEYQADYTAVRTAIRALVSGGTKSYLLDTSQSRQQVTKLDLNDLIAWSERLKALIGPLKECCSGTGGGGTTHVIPGF